MSRRRIPCSERWTDKRIMEHRNRIELIAKQVERLPEGKYKPPK